MKPALRKLCMLLTLGAIINIATAWLIAVRCPLPQPSSLKWQGIRWLYGAPPQWPDPDRRWTLSSQGMQVTIVHGLLTKPGPFERDIIDRTYRQMQITVGYPFPALSMFAEYESLAALGELEWNWHGSWRIPIHNKADKARMIPIKGLPLIPVWPGFLINTVSYAAALWLLLAISSAPLTLRRSLRIKRSLCPACAYPIGTSPVCTECGKPVRPKACSPVAGA